MKRLLCLICCLCLVACFNGGDTRQQEYYEYLKILDKSSEYSKKEAPCTIKAYQTTSDYSKYHYYIVISDPKIKLEKLKVVAYPIGYKNDEIVPNFNILEDVDITTFNNKQSAIKLNYFSENNYTQFKVLLSYQNDGSNYEEIYLKDIVVE
ncbi:hypothetical protein OKW22_000394 [Bacilli bacterium PM5-3]|nr:hypothetical protein [Bacilli bacterium PM5-3]